MKSSNEHAISTRGHVFSSYIKILSSVAALTKEENAINEEQEEPPLYLSGAPKARLFTSAISSSRKQRICIKPWTHYPRRHIQYTLLGWGEEGVRLPKPAVEKRGESGWAGRRGRRAGCGVVSRVAGAPLHPRILPSSCGNGINRAAIWLPLSQGNLITLEIYGVVRGSARDNVRGDSLDCTVGSSVGWIDVVDRVENDDCVKICNDGR